MNASRRPSGGSFPSHEDPWGSLTGPSQPEGSDGGLLGRVAPGELESPETLLKRHLLRRGLKYTQERREILLAVLSTHAHFVADVLHASLAGHKTKASKATVYRTLALFEECGLIRKVFQGPQGGFFEHVYGHQHHEHMICLKCGRQIEFISEEMEERMEKACQAYGFHPLRHHLQVFGFCPDCHPCGRQFPP